MPPPCSRCGLLVYESGAVEKVVVLELSVCAVLFEGLMDESAPVRGRGYEVHPLDPFPVPVQSYHHAGGGDAAAAGHHEVFYIVREVLRLRRNCGEQRVAVPDDIDAVLDNKAVFLRRQLFCAGV